MNGPKVNQPTCICAEVKVGGVPSGSYNLNLDCSQHGVNSEWWNSPEQVALRQQEGDLLRLLQIKARAARELGHGCSSGAVLEPRGDCDVCDATRSQLDGTEVK